MKAITLTQPWAALVAIGAKQIETRSWSTSYRGPLAIHAAKGFPAWARELCEQEPFKNALVGCDLPTGVVVATCHLKNVVPTERISVGELERAFGDYSPGRFAWILSDIVPVMPPIAARGMLGLWDWES